MGGDNSLLPTVRVPKSEGAEPVSLPDDINNACQCSLDKVFPTVQRVPARASSSCFVLYFRSVQSESDLLWLKMLLE